MQGCIKKWRKKCCKINTSDKICQGDREAEEEEVGKKHPLCCFPFLELCSVTLSDQGMFPLN